MSTAKVRAFLEKYGMEPEQIVPARNAAAMCEEMERGLAGLGGSLQMIPTYLSGHGQIPQNEPVAVINHIQNCSGEKTFPKGYDSPGTAFFSGFYKCFPDIIFPALQKQDLDLCLCSLLYAVKTGGNHFCIVDDQAVSRMQFAGDLPENAV